ncbi:MAG: CehA/McbA family metallohydrolase [Myxococcota bacterium]|jgi:hypothetical protein|nr:CehA/McbA family metallohydrolase [Myxococcota bacterium]
MEIGHSSRILKALSLPLALLCWSLLGGCEAGNVPESPGGPSAQAEAGGGPDPREGLSPDAKLETEAMLREDMATPRSPSDGGGRAWRLASDHTHVAGTRERLEIVFETGPLGISEDGAIFLQPSPFWEWDPPQARFPDAPGFSEVTEIPQGVEIELDDRNPGMLIAWVHGRPLEAGETFHFVYGAGSEGAKIDRYAEEQTPIYIAVDGDGDGVRAFIEHSPRIDIVGGPPRQLRLTLPTTARPGETLRLTVAALDRHRSLSPVAEGRVVLTDPPPGLIAPPVIELGGIFGGRRTLEFKVEEPGVYRLEAVGEGELEGLTAISNPVVVAAEAPRIAWGDLHGHSLLSDGTGTPRQYFAYARDVAALDVAALTDHDHWGMKALDGQPEFWSQTREAVSAFNQPGRFVALLGYEWTSWLHGHRHVLYFSDQGEVYSSMDPRYQTPAQLWDALGGQTALTFAHHSAGGPVATNWLYPPDPVLEPLTEIVSVHGSSEAPDSPLPIYDPVPGNYVRDALNAGYRLGFLGSGDSHDGHPGIREAGQSAGLAAIFTPELTREGVLEALRARRVYATNGARIYLRVELDAAPMGSFVEGARGEEAGNQRLRVEIVAPEPIVSVDLIRSGASVAVPVDHRTRWTLEREIPALRPGEYHYVRVTTEGEGAAWSSPIFAR